MTTRDAPPAPFQARTSPWRIAVGLAGALAGFGAGGFALVEQRFSFELRCVGWFLVLLAVVGAVVLVPLAARRMLDRRPQVRIDRDGIWSRKWGFEPVPWAAVARVRVMRRTAQRRWISALALDLHDPEPYTTRLSAVQRASRDFLARRGELADFGDLDVTFNGLTPGLPAAVEFIVADLGVAVDDPNL